MVANQNQTIALGAPAEDNPAGPAPESAKFRILYDLAVALTSDHSLSENLRLIVTTCRRMLGTDTAYVALVENNGREVRMHTTSGIRTRAFREMAMPVGMGLGGLVVKTRRGCIVADYFSEERLERAVDPIVAQEELISGMAAPLRMGPANLGVLYAFNRRHTAFSQDNLDTLLLLANLAAGEVSRRGVEQSLAEAKAQLEQRVVQRTESLTRANRMLFQEVDQRKKAQHELLEEKERFRILVEHSPLGISLVDAGGNYLYVNPAFIRMFGYRLEEVRDGRQWRQLAFPDPELREKARRLWREDLSELGPYATRARVLPVKCADGASKIVHFRPVALAGGENLVTYEDVSQSIAAQDALVAREAHLRAVFQGSQDSIVTTDARWRITDFNPSFLEHFGYSAEDVEGRPLSLLAGGEDRFQKWLAHAGQALTKQGSWRGEWGFVTREGRPLLAEAVVSTLFDAKSNPHGFAAVIRDVSDRIAAEKEKARLEGELRQAQKMEAIGTLASGIAHDFNNIMQGISGLAQMVLSHQSGCSEDTRHLWEILRSVDRASDLVRRLLTFGRKMEPVLTRVDLNAEVAQAVSILKRAVPKMVEIETRLAAGLWPMEGDPNQLGQMLMNLGANARDAMPEGGRLTFSTANLTVGGPDQPDVSGVAPGPYLELTVEDTGDGIKPAVLPHIFDPFFTTKEVGRGTGLGLSTVYGVVKAHQGHVAAENRPNGGARFRALLPAKPGARPAPSQEADPQPPAGKPRECLLVVEDEPSILEVTRSMLVELGHTVLSAESGEKALEIYRRHPGRVDVVLLDLGMPGMGGEACLKELARVDPLVKVVITSGYAQDNRILSLVDRPGRAFVSKPYRLTDLTKEIRRLMDN